MSQTFIYKNKDDKGSVNEDHVFITSHVVISGNCLIKKYSYLGVNSSLKDGIIKIKMIKGQEIE